MTPRLRIFSFRANILFLSLIIVALFFRVSPLGTKLFFSRIVLEYLYYPFSSLSLIYENYKNYREENLRLKRDIIELSMRNRRLQEFEIENNRLRKIFSFSPPIDYKFILTRVIARGDGNSFVTIDISENPEINTDSDYPVMVAEGLVGRTLNISSNTASVMLLYNPNFQASLLNIRSRVYGIMRAKNNRELYLNEVPIGSDIDIGDRLITSGLGGFFPKGLPVGTVKRVHSPKASIFMEIEIEPSADLSRLEEVFILTPDSLNNGENEE